MRTSTTNRALEPMSVVDTAWLRMDSADNLMVINGLLIFDETISREDFQSILEERLLKLHKRFRQRPVQVGNHYFWEELSQLDLGYHLTSLDSLEECGTEAEIRTAVSKQIPLPLDGDKPLWRFFFVPRYKNGTAVMMKVHHSYADGIALISVLDSVADQSVLHSSPAANFRLPERKPRSASSLHRLEFALTSAAFYTGFSLAWLYEAMRVILARPDSKTAYKRKLTAEKQVGWAPSLEVSEVKQVSKAMGCTMNDVILGCVAGSLRRYLERIGEPVQGVQVRTTVPVNLRPLDQALQLGNKFGLVYLTLPVGEPTVERRIRAVRQAMRQLKSGVQAQMSYNVLGILGFFPRPVEKFFLDFFSSKASAVMTNVPGPSEPVYLKGKKLAKPMFWVPQSGGIGIGVSILSYDNKVEFGFVADSALVPDPQAMIDDFVAEFESIKQTVLGASSFPGQLSHV
ncbi:MAG TPA: wax ester/triacylglycerol synthase family O-acyltransferase [Dongiaceae bacterium]|nr:wax ester/triacylglycerol synthase family O-acyltransferase [Dongiaceae bacterium]